ncbi:hypothetical protein [uncultured Bradyrhizobium sp.]|nr:hypothetical protein [uncultured Bradyrhizobium sp.]
MTALDMVAGEEAGLLGQSRCHVCWRKPDIAAALLDVAFWPI